jgi:HK97 family phage prohead protease
MKTVLVYGSACSGKNTYVREHSSEGDLIIDFDALHQAISGLESHEHNQNLIGYVYDARDALLNRVLDKGHTQTVWIIHSAPTKADRRKFIDEFGAELIHIDTSKEECLERAAKERPEAWIEYINNWFERYEPEDVELETREHIEVPQYIQDNAARGLEFYKQGFGGDGLVNATINDAKDMADGIVSHKKAKDMNSWFLRHISDLDSDNARAYLNGESDKPTKGQTAWLLWGGSIEEANQMDAQKWAERYIATLEEEDTGERMSEIKQDKVFTSAPKQVRPTPEHDIRFVTNQFEIRALEGSKAVITGYASVFNKKSQVLGGGFVEVINKGAFKKTLQERGTQTSRDDIKALFNHDTSLVLGSKRAGTLQLAEDKQGLHYEVSLDLDIPHHRSAYMMIERGDVTNSSFGFDVLDETWSVPDDSNEPVVREVLETRLYEVSPTAFPAYQDSTVMAERSFRNLAQMSGLDLNQLIEANENGELKSLLQEEEEVVFNAEARKRRLELLKKS